jgi:predicted TIM-barrel fold metal-dependent hydrolase
MESRRRVVVDVHAHLFNLRYWPVAGIVRRYVEKLFPVPALWQAIAEALLKLGSMEEPALDGDWAFASARPFALHDASGSTAAGGWSAESQLASLLESATEEQVAKLIVSRLPDAVLMEPELARLTTLATPDSLHRQLLPGSDRVPRAELERRRDALATFLSDESNRRDGFLSFLARMCRNEIELARDLDAIHEQARLVVHHLLDLENAYFDDPPSYSIPRQIERMRNLMRWSGGKLLPFIGFDPFRNGGIEFVRSALRSGFAGVKMYPPSSFRAIGNVEIDRWTQKYGQTPGDEVDRRNFELFKYCVAEDVPIMAHCTPGGFQRSFSQPEGGTGQFSDPLFWRKVLEGGVEVDGQPVCLPTLRLSLGHGGGEGWLQPVRSFNASFAASCVKLCQDFRNVYCDLGHLAALAGNDPRPLGQLIENLKCVLQAESDTPPRYSFFEKVMFGTDYYMPLHKGGNWRRYVREMLAVFDGTRELQPYAAGFAGENALRFLSLRDYLGRCGSLLSVAERTHLSALVR